jgi:hypothetical protein
MRGFAITVAALSILAAGAVTAQADVNYGPVKQGSQCWNASPSSGDHRANGFGYWGACPAPASGSVATTPRVSHKKSSR